MVLYHLPSSVPPELLRSFGQRIPELFLRLAANVSEEDTLEGSICFPGAPRYCIARSTVCFAERAGKREHEVDFSKIEHEAIDYQLQRIAASAFFPKWGMSAIVYRR